MISIIVSKKDTAGMNIKACLADKGIDAITIAQDSIDADNLDLDSDLYIFATKHKSAEKVPSLCVHTPGNWLKAEHGGFESQLCISPALWIKYAYLGLKKQAPEHNVTLEATHHGPYLKKPAMFIEIGSSEQEWQRKDLGEIIAKTLVNISKTEPQHQ
ncbi:MAG: hypothetical protein KJ601_06920, partial [Nanoarchaeota archaeon]|nr:hypothetical protein [Nanoarchaeota archaeon]MBU1704756.1 hypothetical protein [Nanoarchaeota archaeon]